jgi:hypothetical protein
MKKIFLLFFPLFFCSFHPYYMSVTELNYNAKEKALQGSVKMFVNDLENSLKKITGKTADLIHPVDTTKTNKLLSGYLESRLRVTVNGNVKPLKIIGFEQEAENIWVFLEVRNCPIPGTISIHNSILYESLKEQINIVHVEVKGIKKSHKLVNPESTAKFSF